MANAAAERTEGGTQVYYTTAFELRTSSTSTPTLLMWRALSDKLAQERLPMTAAELSEAVGIAPKRLEEIFAQTFYQRAYGFTRFTSLDEFEAWAWQTGVFYQPKAVEEGPAEEDDAEEEPGEDA